MHGGIPFFRQAILSGKISVVGSHNDDGICEEVFGFEGIEHVAGGGIGAGDHAKIDREEFACASFVQFRCAATFAHGADGQGGILWLRKRKRLDGFAGEHRVIRLRSFVRWVGIAEIDMQEKRTRTIAHLLQIVNRLRGAVFVFESGNRPREAARGVAGCGMGMGGKVALGRCGPGTLQHSSKFSLAVEMVIYSTMAGAVVPREQIFVRVIVPKECGFITFRFEEAQEIRCLIGNGAFVVDGARAIGVRMPSGEHCEARWDTFPMHGKVIFQHDSVLGKGVQSRTGAQRMPQETETISAGLFDCDQDDITGRGVCGHGGGENLRTKESFDYHKLYRNAAGEREGNFLNCRVVGEWRRSTILKEVGFR